MVHYDLLRVLAAFSVVMLHTSAQFWYTLPVTGTHWLIANSYNALFRFGVPVFVMISGALFLSDCRKADMKKLYLRNILRLGVIFILWSCIYGLIDCTKIGIREMPPDSILREMLYGRYHLWYIPMIIGIYMLIPILKIWVQNAPRRNIEYFLLLFLIFQIGKETINALFPYDELIYVTTLINPYMVCGYLGYFVLGYYISHYGISRKYCRIIYIAALPSAACNLFLSWRLSIRKGAPLAAIDDCFGIFTFIIICALFLFFTDKVSAHSFGKTAGKITREAALDTLGVYLMHVGLIELLEPAGIHSMMLPNIIGIPLFAVFCYLSCSAVTAVLRRIPLIGKYLC